MTCEYYMKFKWSINMDSLSHSHTIHVCVFCDCFSATKQYSIWDTHRIIWSFTENLADPRGRPLISYLETPKLFSAYILRTSWLYYYCLTPANSMDNCKCTRLSVTQSKIIFSARPEYCCPKQCFQYVVLLPYQGIVLSMKFVPDHLISLYM